MRCFKLNFLILVLSFLFTTLSFAKSDLIDRLVATVKTKIILQSDLDEFRRTLSLRSKLDPLFNEMPISKKGASASYEEIRQFLADEALITQEFPVENQEVEQEIMNIQNSNKITREALVDALKKEGFAFKDYFELVRNNVSKRNLIDREIRTKASVSEDDIKNYYYNNESDAKKDSQLYHIQLISIQKASRGGSQSATQKAGAEAIQALNRGEAFETVAQSFSDHPSQENGGDLGFLPYDQLSNDFKKEIKKIKIGAHSGLIGTAETGFFILKLKDIKSGGSNHFNERKDEIQQILLTQEFRNQIKNWLVQKRTDAIITFVDLNK